MLAVRPALRYAAMVFRQTAIWPLAAMLFLAFGLGWLTMRPPAVLPTTASKTSFSAARAMGAVRMVSSAPHPSGSPSAVSVRRALAQRLRATGLSVFSLRGIGAGFSSGKTPSAQAGDVETLVAILPGRDRNLPAIAMMAHTDSVPGSFGAADDGFGVAVALETMRAISAGGRPMRDVVLILTDGEEAGLLGARLFFADPGRAARIGALVNIDSRGTSGLGTMFETGPGSGGLIDRYRAVGNHRFAHSAATFLYRLLPNRTDLTATTGLDIPALNFAFLDGEFDYHTPRDALANVDPRTLQSLGDQVFPFVRSIADDAKPIVRGPDGVFVDAYPAFAIRYPVWIGWPLLALAGALAGIGMAGTGLVPMLRAATGSVATALVTMTAARLGYALTGVGSDWGAHHRIMAAFGRYELAMALIATCCLLGAAVLLRRGCRRGLVALCCLAMSGVAVVLGQPPVATAVIGGAAALAALWAFAKPLSLRAVQGGVLGVALILSLAIQMSAPALTPLVLWPTLAAAGGIVAVRYLDHGRWIAALFGIFPLGYLIVFGHSVLLALGIPTPEAIGVFALFAASIVLPLAGEMSLAVAGIGIGLAAMLLLSFHVTPATERHPDLSQVYGVADADGRNWLVSPLQQPDPWTAHVLWRGGRAPIRATMPLISSDPVWRVPAKPFGVSRPLIVVGREDGQQTMTIIPASGGRTIALQLVTDRALGAVTVGGRALPDFAGRAGTFKLRWQSPGRPAVLRFHADRGTHLTLTAAETTEGRIPLPARPANVVPWLGSDRLIAIGRVHVRF